MKLSNEQAQHVADQLSGQAIDEEHPSGQQLKQAAGDHTFFVNNDGLHVVEPRAMPGGADGAVIKIGSWSEEQEGHLKLHEPEIHGEVSLDPPGAED
jgi:hypothetical protein